MSPVLEYRTATPADIPGMQVVRRAVKENALSDPGRVTDADYLPFLDARGRGWVACIEARIVGFAIADTQDDNIWALFVLPACEGAGIGKELHRRMLDWYFAEGKTQVWLSTAFDTRAEAFYRLQGWTDKGACNAIERRFEMTAEEWERRRGG